MPVWPATLRWLHWLNVVAIVVLTVTGFFIADPFFSPGDGQRTGFFMGWVRFVHYAVSYGWVTLGVIRIYLLLFSRNRFVRWPALWPIKGKQDVRNLGRTISAYLLIHPDEAPTYIAHNPLQQLSYTAIYIMAALQVVTGLALYGLYDSHQWFWALLHWPVRVGSMVGQLLEEIHLGGLDACGHARLGEALARAVAEVRAAVDADLVRELDLFAPTVDPRVTVSEPELRVRHAQLVGWITGILGTVDPDHMGLPPLL